MRRLDLLVLALGLSALGAGLAKWSKGRTGEAAAAPVAELRELEQFYGGWSRDRLLVALRRAERERASTIEAIVRALTEAGDGRVVAGLPGELPDSGLSSHETLPSPARGSTSRSARTGSSFGVRSRSPTSTTRTWPSWRRNARG